MSIYVVRHGSTDLNEGNKMRGWLNPTLSPLGEKEASMAGETLKDIPFDEIYSSDLTRAIQTAMIIGANLNNGPEKINISNNFRPINFGEYQGKPFDEISQNITDLFSKWETDPLYKENGSESFSDFQDRIFNAIKSLFDIQKQDSKKNIMLVTHVRVCDYTLALVMNHFKRLEGESIRILNYLSIEPANYLKFESEEVARLSGLSH